MRHSVSQLEYQDRSSDFADAVLLARELLAQAIPAVALFSLFVAVWAIFFFFALR